MENYWVSQDAKTSHSSDVHYNTQPTTSAVIQSGHKSRLVLSGCVKLAYLDVTVLRRGEGEVRVVEGRAPACWQVWRGMQYKEECFIAELETSARTESKRMTNHNTR
jgi:hypothetical protein